MVDMRDRSGEKDGRAEAGAAPAAGPKTGPGTRLLLAVLAGIAVLGLGLLAFDRLVLPSNAATDPSKLYDYVYASGKSENVDFVLNAMSDDGYLCFGSSEWYISKDKVSMCPQAVFGEANAGVDMTYVGEGYDQSLWQAIAAGAYGSDEKLANKKVMLVVSPQWFFKGNGDENKFYTKFSYSLYRAFMQSPSISEETKAYVRSRCAALGVDAGKLAAASHDTLDATLNDVAYAAADSWQLRSKLDNITHLAPTKSSTRASGAATGEPDWDALLEAAQAEGAAASTSNDFGVYDAFWEKNHTFDPELFQNFDEAEDEYADLACFLDVCREVGLDPLVCILPVHGQWYDVSDVSREDRAAYYERIRQICEDAGVSYADFSGCEYEKYFLCDTVHPGWVGWVRIEHAFYDFVTGQDNEYLTWGDDAR